MTGDRRVHARGSCETRLPNEGVEIIELVRYHRAGKWYVEGPCIGRRNVSFAAAVDIAQTIARNDGTVFFGVLGGGAFDKQLEDYRPT